MKEKSNQAQLKISPEALERLKGLAISESGFLFDPITGYSYNLNSTALELIHLLQAGKDRQQMMKQMLDVYDVHVDDFDRDFEQFLGLLQEYGLLPAAAPKKKS